jgi:hypothetical protein
MGSFLVITAADESQDEAVRLFQFGLEAVHSLKNQVPNSTVETGRAYAASFARYNGSGSPIVSDPETGSWLLADGTWVHTEGYGSGSESRLLNRYLDVGPLRLGLELEGFFVIVVGDGRTGEIVVLTDIVGSCHCFMRVWKDTVALSSSALLLASLDNFRLDHIGCQEFLYTGVMYEDRTFYQEVRKLGPGTVFRFADGVLKTKERYWQITDIVPESLHGLPAVRQLSETLISAAQRIGHLFEHVMCDLTGGYDSRAIVAAFLTAGVKFSTTVSGAAESPDVRVSRSLAQIAGSPHVHLVSQEPESFGKVKQAFSLTDGEYDLVEYSRILEIHRNLSARFDISINGSFGEIARGYWWDLLFPQVGACKVLDAYKLASARFATQIFDASLFPPETRLNLVAHFAGVIERTNAGLALLPNTLQMDYVYLMMRMQRWQGRIASSTNTLWPCLSPFLFRSVLETMLQTSSRLRSRSLLIRRMLADMQPRLAEMPLEHGYPALPISWRTLFRFWPLPVYYGKKIVSKFIPTAGTASSRADNIPVRLRLWQEDEVRTLLQPAAMKLRDLVDSASLYNFIKQSQQSNFSFNDQWTRLLGLEYTLHVLAGANTNLIGSRERLSCERR